ncbi:MAG: alkaline phosphatase family protein [Gemmatimonadetes bacterium]|nr:alkaline phosphatase family protein [Gemmatimonadota bacterium]
MLLSRLVTLAVLAVFVLPVHARAQTGHEPRVLVIGIDGVRVDMLARAETPTLDSLSGAGFFSDEAKTRVRTVSGPGWSSMLTGVRTDKHGVDSNNFSGNRYAEWPDFLTRVEAERPELGTFAVLDWPPLGTTDSGGPLISDGIDVKLNFDGETDGYGPADAESVEAAVEHLRTADVHAAFVYLGNPDVVSHETDSFSDEYRASIERADAQTAELLDALRARPGYDDEDWLILVSTDHGRNDAGGHGGQSPSETTIFFLAAGPAVSPGRTDCPPEIVDVAATALAHLGIVAPELDGQPRGLGPRGCAPE